MKDAASDQLVGKHERNWAEIESVQEAVEGVSNRKPTMDR